MPTNEPIYMRRKLENKIKEENSKNKQLRFSVYINNYLNINI